ncbi:MAG TPA: site-specific DNA-methyltransferase [Devosiaceae bacterium]
MNSLAPLPTEKKDCDTDRVRFLEPQDVFSAFDQVEKMGAQPRVTILDPWYNKGFGGVINDDDYNKFIEELLQRSCALSEHVFLWGFPEIIGPYVRSIPSSHELVAWLTWFYKNNPSVIRGWRSSQNACLHIARPGAKLYPESFLNEVQKEKYKEGKLRYVPGPTSVIESSLLIGFVGKKEQTGHPSQKPIAVYDKIIRMTTVEDDLIFDPMCGSGTTGAVALIRKRQAIQSDMSAEYLQMAKERLSLDYDGFAQRLDELGNNPDKPKKDRKPKPANTGSLF